MANRQIIVVSGATGQQGGSVIDGLVKDSRFQKDFVIRGLTRHPDSPRCQELKKLGVEFWKADFSDPTSLDAALNGASFFFMLTNPFDPSQYGDKELEVGKRIVDELIKNKVPNLIFSTLPNVEQISNGKYNVPHFTNKAKIEEYIRSNKDKFKTIHFILPTFYFQNLLNYGKMSDDGTELVFSLPLKETTTMPALDIHDLSKVVPNMILHPEKTNGQTIPLVGENLEIQEYIRLIGEVLGIKTRYNKLTYDQYRQMNSSFPMVDELTEMYRCLEEYGLLGTPVPQLESIRKLVGNNNLVFTPFREWVKANERDPKWCLAQLKKESMGEKMKSGVPEERFGTKVQTGTG